MPTRAVTSIIISSGPNRFELIAGVALLILYGLASFGAASWVEFWMIGAIGLFLTWAAWHGNVRLTNDALSIRDWLLQWKRYPFENLRWVHLNDPKRITLDFGDRVIISRYGLPKYKLIKERITDIARRRISYFGYRHAYRHELRHHQLCGCLTCLSVFPKEEVKYWKALEIKFLGIPLAKTKRVAVCGNCKSDEVVRASDPKTPMEWYRLHDMQTHYFSSLKKNESEQVLVSEGLYKP